MDIVLSSRARLARNVTDLPFVHRMTDEQRRRTMTQVTHALDSAAAHAEPLEWVDLESTSALDRRVLYERHLISRPHADATGPRGVAVAEDASLSVMVNEEDHVRMHAIAPGRSVASCFTRIRQLDEAMEPFVDWAWHQTWGYQSACPTNAGTGVRFSAMLHLPALRLTRELDKVRQAAKDLHLAVRGYYGEGSESSGSFFQVSNQITLGRSEEELLDTFVNSIVPGVVEYERAARAALLKQDRTTIADRVLRDLAILRSAQLVKADEAMRRLSMIRLGVCIDLIPDVELGTVNGLFREIQAGHLQQAAGTTLSQNEARAARATLLRQRLGGG
jgi:protein arginine kinase